MNVISKASRACPSCGEQSNLSVAFSQREYHDAHFDDEGLNVKSSRDLSPMMLERVLLCHTCGEDHDIGAETLEDAHWA